MSLSPIVSSFPLGGLDPQGRLAESRDEQSVNEVILNILLTRPGERLMRPDFGAGLLDFLHQPNNETTRGLIASTVRNAVSRWETRITLSDVQVIPDPAEPTTVHITLFYSLRQTGRPVQFNLALNLGSLD